MKAFWNWIIKNLANIFGLIGIVLTLYFGVFYVPGWLKEAQQEKFHNAQKNLQQSLKELIYSDSICNYSEVTTLIKAKELELNQTYPFTPEEIFTQIQESFMQDRFLPLEKRKELMTELEILKKQVPKSTKKEIEKGKTKESTWLFELLSIIVSIIGVLAGIISFFLKFKTEKEKDEEIENQIIETENLKTNIEYAIDYEKQIIKTISNYSGVIVKRTPNTKDFGMDFGFDLEFEFNRNPYFVEIKYLTRSKVGLNSIKKFISHQKGLEGQFWFVYNTGLTDMVKREVEDWNKVSSPNRKVVLINAENEIELKNQIKKLLPTT